MNPPFLSEHHDVQEAKNPDNKKFIAPKDKPFSRSASPCEATSEKNVFIQA